jgi:hypothetical protein
MKALTTFNLSFVFILALLGVYSCKKESITTASITQSASNAPTVLTAPGSEGCMEFAAETANPYTVQNMQAALQPLRPTMKLSVTRQSLIYVLRINMSNLCRLMKYNTTH